MRDRHRSRLVPPGRSFSLVPAGRIGFCLPPRRPLFARFAAKVAPVFLHLSTNRAQSSVAVAYEPPAKQRIIFSSVRRIWRPARTPGAGLTKEWRASDCPGCFRSAGAPISSPSTFRPLASRDDEGGFATIVTDYKVSPPSRYRPF